MPNVSPSSHAPWGAAQVYYLSACNHAAKSTNSFRLLLERPRNGSVCLSIPSYCFRSIGNCSGSWEIHVVVRDEVVGACSGGSCPCHPRRLRWYCWHGGAAGGGEAGRRLRRGGAHGHRLFSAAVQLHLREQRRRRVPSDSDSNSSQCWALAHT